MSSAVTSDEPNEVTLQEAAELLGVRRERVWRLVRSSVLTARRSKLDRRVQLIPKSEIEQLVREEAALLRRRRRKKPAAGANTSMEERS